MRYKYICPQCFAEENTNKYSGNYKPCQCGNEMELKNYWPETKRKMDEHAKKFST